MNEILLFVIILLALFVQGSVGFGSALIAMPFLIQGIGVQTAAPLFSMLGATGSLFTMAHYARHWRLKSVLWLIVGSTPSIPLGIILAHSVDQTLILVALGILMIGYALYSLFSPHIPYIQNDRWGIVFGAFNGLLAGAYNTGGPPLVIFGNARRWQPAEFKTNLQTVLFMNTLFTLSSHLLSGNITALVLGHYVLLIPAVFIGLLLGYQTDKFIPTEVFRRAVLVLLIVLGLSLIF